MTTHLIDASPYIFRAWFALPQMLAPDGSPKSATYGFLGFLLRYLKEERPTHLGVAFDESLSTSFRNEVYPDYKAQRELPPPELEAQQRDCQALTRALGIATFVSQRYEADDLIATLAGPLTKAGHDVVIVSSDKDLCQLVDERVTLFDFARGLRFAPAEVEAKFGVRPAQIADFLGLAGDAVDNIPGVRGIGAKSAAALLGHFADLDALYADLAAVEALPLRGAKSVAGKLARERDLAFLSRELATLRRDAPVAAARQELAWDGAEHAALEPLFARLGFESVLERIPRPHER